MSKATMIGWDIGGAHLKAVVLDANGVQLSCIQLPCALWRGLTELELGIKAVFSQTGLQAHNVLHVVTMTGELVDLFPNRYTGVCEIARYAAGLLGKDTCFYAANNGFVQLDDVAEYVPHIASTNWHASASLLAKHVDHVLLIDIGSTTTDIIPIAHGKVAMQGLSDASRMQHDALVYTGVVRTPIMALAQKLSLNDGIEEIEMNVAAEFFATMADVYRLTDELPLAKDMAETADGQGKTQQESARRLARMVGFDLEDKPIETWMKLAFSCRALQLKQLKAATLKHLKPNTPIIGAGAGSFLVKVLAAELDCEYRLLTDILKTDISLSDQLVNESQLADLELCFPAYAVARLALASQLPHKVG
ncbi:hydantoinase/oxoprolinase family protein [Methylotenera versatilis]|uniref:hydantoinase/oxoprolinase family protein n=1 Tax=Methylotenera versatilis TaxID=1055487 RepID=UPI0006483982|nr:hydantoinase/oxoprolinase family protein [Methylotenera versatilis]